MTDTERIEWLIRQEDPENGGSIEWWHGTDPNLCMLVVTQHNDKRPPRFEGRTLRECIDAAIVFETHARSTSK